MKRFMVMDLYHADQIEPVEGEWNKVSDGLPQLEKCKVKVKLSDDTETFAYFCMDRCEWIAIVGKEPCFFWNCSSYRPIFDVQYWKHLKESQKTTEKFREET